MAAHWEHGNKAAFLYERCITNQMYFYYSKLKAAKLEFYKAYFKQTESWLTLIQGNKGNALLTTDAIHLAVLWQKSFPTHKVFQPTEICLLPFSTPSLWIWSFEAPFKVRIGQ